MSIQRCVRSRERGWAVYDAAGTKLYATFGVGSKARAIRFMKDKVKRS